MLEGAPPPRRGEGSEDGWVIRFVGQEGKVLNQTGGGREPEKG